MLNRSPSGSVCPYYYMGGELQPLKYGSFRCDKNRLFSIMKAEEEFILKSPGQNNRRIWIDLYETRLDDEVILALAKHISAIKDKVFRLCLVGCPLMKRRKIKAQIDAGSPDIAARLKFYSDPEKAKQWLVSETS